MSITLTFNDVTDELAAKLLAVASGREAILGPELTDKEKKTTKKRRTKAQIEADKKEEEEFKKRQAEQAKKDAENQDDPFANTGGSDAGSLTEDTSEAGDTPSADAVRAALTRLNEAKGLEVAKETLATFQVKRISELVEDQYAGFIAACDEKAAAE